MIEVVVVSVVAIVGLVVLSYSQGRQLAKAWSKSSEVERETREHHIARITTLENRLASNSWDEFAGLQSVPDELAKAAWAESQHRNFSFGETPQDLVASRATSDGADLEGESFEGPTIG